MKNAVAAIIRQGNKVLLHQRSFVSRGQPGKWENAGGEVDEGETKESAIIREIKEELGVDFIIDKIALEVVVNNTDSDWTVTLFTGSIIGEPMVMIPEETQAVKWFSLDELGSIDLAPYTRQDFVTLGWIK